MLIQISFHILINAKTFRRYRFGMLDTGNVSVNLYVHPLYLIINISQVYHFLVYLNGCGDTAFHHSIGECFDGNIILV